MARPEQGKDAYPVGQRVWPSIASAAGALGCDKELLREAKRQGCPAFRSHRVYEADLLPWVVKQQPVDDGPKNKTQLQCELLAVQIERAKFSHETERGEWLPKPEVEGFILNAIERIKSILRERLKNELPPKLEGLRAAEIAARMDGVILDCAGALKGMFDP